MRAQISLLSKLAVLCLSVGLSLGAQAQTKPDANAAPNEFVQQVADQVLAALKADSSVRSGNTTRVNQLVDELIFPNLNFEKRLSSCICFSDELIHRHIFGIS